MARNEIIDRIGRKVPPVRCLVFCLILVGGFVALLPQLGPERAVLAAFDAASLTFLMLVLPLLDSRADEMRSHARNNDANRVLLLLLCAIITGVILLAVASEMHARADPLKLGLIIATLALAWLFSNTIYALHYANLFYRGDGFGADFGGLDFPDCVEPNYWDFAYFSFTLGMTFQTSDVSITETRIRQTVIGHCLIAFVFNIGVLAFSINVLGGG